MIVLLLGFALSAVVTFFIIRFERTQIDLVALRHALGQIVDLHL